MDCHDSGPATVNRLFKKRHDSRRSQRILQQVCGHVALQLGESFARDIGHIVQERSPAKRARSSEVFVKRDARLAGDRARKANKRCRETPADGEARLEQEARQRANKKSRRLVNGNFALAGRGRSSAVGRGRSRAVHNVHKKRRRNKNNQSCDEPSVLCTTSLPVCDESVPTVKRLRCRTILSESKATKRALETCAACLPLNLRC
eukprot:759713-Hanusia_phi.AAC.1